MTEVKIERGIPMPPKHAKKVRYPWAAMKVGDSFAVTNGSNARQLCVQANYSHAPKQFESRGKSGEWRVWRIR